MAQSDNILRLRIDSTEYDSKIKSATDGLSRFMDGLKKGVSNIRDIDKESLEYVKSLGQMETKSSTVRGRIAELSKAYVELTSRYKQLSDEAKNSEFGRAMAASLEQIRQRVVEAKKEFNDLGRSIGNLPTGTKEVGGPGALLTGVNDAISAAQGGISGMLGALGKFGPQAAAIGGISAAIIGLGSSAIEARRNIENLELNIGTLLGSAQKGKELVQELQQYGQVTPYDTEGLAGAARTMLAYGVSAERIMPLMKQLGDVAQGNTQNLNSLALAFGQMTAVGTVQKQDLNQMANAGFGFNQIAKSMGITVEEFLDMVSKKKVSVNDIARALEDATSAGGLFYNSAINASKGLEGTFSNFEESLTSTKAKLGALIEPAVINVVQALGEGVEELTQDLGGSEGAAKAFALAGEGLGSVIKGLFGNLAEVISVAKAFGEIFEEVKPIIEAIVPPTDSAKNSVDALNTSFANANSSPLINAVKNLFNPLDALIAQLKNVRDGIIKAKQAAFGDTPSSSNRNYSSQQVAAMQRAAVKEGRASYVTRNGSTYFANAAGETRGHHKYVRGRGWMRNTVTYDENGATWRYVDDPNYDPRKETQKTSSRKNTQQTRPHKPARAGAKIEDLSYRSARYGSVNQAGEWVWSEAGATRYNKANPQPRNTQQKNPSNRVNEKTPAKTKKEPQTKSDIQKRITELTDEWASTTSETKRSSIEKQISELNRQKDELTKVSKIGSSTKKTSKKTTKREKTEEERNNEKIKVLRDEYNDKKTSEARKTDIIEEVKVLNERNKAIQRGNDELNGIKPDSVKALNKDLSELKNNQQLSSTNKEWDEWQVKIDGTEKKINEIKGIKPGSLVALNSELSDLSNKQNLSETNEEWKEWGKQIDEVKKKIDAITAPDMGKMTDNGISAFISNLKKEIADADIGSDIREKLIEQLNLTNLFQNLVNAGQEVGTSFDQGNLSETYADIQSGTNLEDILANLASMLESVNQSREQKDLGALGVDKDGSLSEQQTGDQDLTDIASKVVSGLANVAGGLQNMGVKLPEGVNKVISFAQGLIQVIQGVQTIISVFSTSQAAVTNTNMALLNGMLPVLISALWANTAAAAIPFHNGGIVHAAGGHAFHDGGVVHAAGGYSVPGNNYSGDLVPAMLNSGELVLNQAQQGNLAAQLSDNENSSASGAAWVSGENIYVALNTFLRRRGMGEIVAFKKK